MSIARHGTGSVAVVRAFGSQIHPVFMLPPVAASVFGATLTGGLAVPIAALHAAATFFSVYTAHVKDGYVDFHHRGEDDDHPLTVYGCRLALAGATVAFLACLVGLGAGVGLDAVAITAPMWLIGFFHAPQLDTNPVTTTCGYPTGIALAVVGGAYVQSGAITPIVGAFAVVFLLMLVGIKTVDDAKDYEYDRSIDKRTVAVVLGPPRARRLAYGLMVAGMAGVVAFALARVFPPGTVVAAGVFAVVAGVSARTVEPALATKLLIRGSYLFLAVLLVAVWWRPLGGV